MSRQQLQESEATTSPDKGVLATVLNYLKAKNLKVTEEALKRELGMQDDVTPTLAHGGTEPEKYEESYSSNAPSSSTSTTRADLQLASTTTLSVNNLKQREDFEDTQSDDEELEPEDDSEDETEDKDSAMEDSSSNHVQVASTTTTSAVVSNFHTASRFSWPGSIQSLQAQLSSQHQEQDEGQDELEEQDSRRPSSTSGTNGHLLSPSDKSPLWVHTSYNFNKSRSSTSSSDVVSPLQKQPQPLILQGATTTQTQIPIGGPFLYQLAPAPGTSLTGASRQQVIGPILTVLPANASLVNPTLARAMNIPTSGQPLLLNATQGLGLSSITQQSLSIAQQQQESPRTSSLSSISLTDTEPTTGQTITSPLIEHVSVHTVSDRTSPTRTLASIPLNELTPQYSELKAFAEEFKSKRIRLGFTQGAVGQSLADKGYSNFAQSTISRFEQMQLSPTNAAAIKQVLEKWLQEAENPEAAHSASSTTNLPFMASRKRKKRAVFTPQTRTSLDNFFKQNPRPNRQMIESIANQLELLPEEVRVWFCNKRQKHKQHQTVYHYDQDLSLATSSGANSPTSLYESSTNTKRSTPSPKTPFTIEELSKSSTTSSSAVSAAQLTSPFMSPTSLVMAVTSPKVFFNPLTSAPVTTTAMPKFVTSPPWSVAQTTA